MIKDRLVLARFCDDIRHEVGNKYSLIGCYGDELFIDKLPGILPKFCAQVQALTPIDRPFGELKFRALLDDDVIAELEVPTGVLKEGKTAAEHAPADAQRLTVNAMMVFSPLVLNQPGRLRIEADTDEGTLRGNAISIQERPHAPDLS